MADDLLGNGERMLSMQEVIAISHLGVSPSSSALLTVSPCVASVFSSDTGTHTRDQWMDGQPPHVHQHIISLTVQITSVIGCELLDMGEKSFQYVDHGIFRGNSSLLRIFL